MTTLCPYCKVTVLTGEADLPRMSARKMRIYKAVLEAGPEGISPTDLLVHMYGEDEWPTAAGPAVLRGQIHYINRLIKEFPYLQRIEARHMGCYRLVSLEKNNEQ